MILRRISLVRIQSSLQKKTTNILGTVRYLLLGGGGGRMRVGDFLTN